MASVLAVAPLCQAVVEEGVYVGEYIPPLLLGEDILERSHG